MDESKLDTLRKLEKFAPKFMYIKPKKGGASALFTFNRAQSYVHQRLEKQREDTGKVRALILKGRQQGISTFIQARFFHKVITGRGRKAFILTHDKEATKNLFDMANRFYLNMEKGLIPKADTQNARELYFREFDSGYAVGTAGNKSVGRSQTLQLFHGSEVGFWSYADEHAKGILQAISDADGTEVILESTANGIGNYFHQRWLSAQGGESEYQAIFVPWYWQDEYKATTEGFNPTEEEDYLLSLYKSDGLTEAHLSWRRLKIEEFSKDYETGKEQFKQEYPFSSTEAFLNPIERVFIPSRLVQAARDNDVEPIGALIIGVDVAISERDKTAIIRRQGRKAFKLERFTNFNTMEICGLLRNIIQKENPHKMYIDCIGIGAGVVDRMHEMGFDNVVEGVNVARSANDKDRYKNLRAELWATMKEWLSQEMEVDIPDDDILHSELCSLGYKPTSLGQIKIESKEDLRARGMPSPDGADALSLTFYGGFHQSPTSLFEVPKRWPGESRMFT